MKRSNIFLVLLSLLCRVIGKGLLDPLTKKNNYLPEEIAIKFQAYRSKTPSYSLLLSSLFMLLFISAELHAQPVDMALVLVIDVSGSIDDQEFELQFKGYAAAFSDNEIIQAMTKGPHGAIAVNILLFSDMVYPLLSWQYIDGQDAALKVSKTLLSVPRVSGGGTHIIRALERAVQELAYCPYLPESMTIDVSGDGPDNEGLVVDIINPIKFLDLIFNTNTQWNNPGITLNTSRLRSLRSELEKMNITVNCVAIEDPKMKNYFQDNLMTGNNSFTVFASSFNSFQKVIKTKILREVKAAVKLSENKVGNVIKTTPPPPRSVASKPNPSSGDVQNENQIDEGEVDSTSTLPGQIGQDTLLGGVVENSKAEVINIKVRDSFTKMPVADAMLYMLAPATVNEEDSTMVIPGKIQVSINFSEKSSAIGELRAPGYEPKMLIIEKNSHLDRVEEMQRSPSKLVW
jgi:hypothetical protein